MEQSIERRAQEVRQNTVEDRGHLGLFLFLLKAESVSPEKSIDVQMVAQDAKHQELRSGNTSAAEKRNGVHEGFETTISPPGLYQCSLIENSYSNR